MKILLLTSDIIDGRFVLKALRMAGKSPIGIIYQREKSLLSRIKTRLKALIYGVAFDYERTGIFAKATDDINAEVDLMKELAPELCVVAGTRKLSPAVLSVPARGSINLHTGILPYYRGADTEFWALYHHERDKVGVTIHYVTEALDAGDVILQKTLAVEPRDNYISLRKKNVRLGARMIVEALRRIEDGSCVPQKQEMSHAMTFRSVSRADAALLCARGQRGDQSVKKIFCGAGCPVVVERVARDPSIRIMRGQIVPCDRSFTLRIDADEYHETVFKECLDVFSEYPRAVTIFINAGAFQKVPEMVAECRRRGLDVQSHAFHHATYSDQESNQRNIQKAAMFFREIGIEPKGFAAPTGRYHPTVMEALEAEGYRYSSDFGYDYMGLPSYPFLKGRRSGILQIPVFPVSPELFLENGEENIERIVGFYRYAIDEMRRAGIPVIVYGHPSKYVQAPKILKAMLRYGVETAGGKLSNMTDRYQRWVEGARGEERVKLLLPPSDILGIASAPSLVDRTKNLIKNVLDIESVTPDHEIVCGEPKRFFKKLLRRKAIGK